MIFNRQQYYRNIFTWDYIQLLFVSLLMGLSRLPFGTIIPSLNASINMFTRGGALALPPKISKLLNILRLPASLNSLMFLILAVWLLNGVIKYIAKNIYIYVNRNIFGRINKMTAAFINQIPLSTYLQHNPGFIKETVIHLDKSMGDALHVIFECFLPECIFISISCMKLWHLDRYLFNLTIIWAILHTTFTFVSMRMMRPYIYQQIQTGRLRSGYYVEMCTLFLLNKFFELQDIFTERAIYKYNEPHLNARQVSLRYDSMLLLIKNLLAWFMIGYMGFGYLIKCLTAQSITDGTFVDLTSTLLWMTNSVTSFSQHINHILTAQQTINAGLEFMEKNITPEPLPSFHIVNSIHSIRCENVSFAHNDKTVFQNVNFTIENAESVAIVGPSGCGKTTLINILCGMLNASSGQVYVNDLPMHLINKHSLMKTVVYIAQASTLINDTIEYNIKLGDMQASDEKIDRLVQNLDLPNKQTEVGNAGVKISGGQQQRVAIARAQNKLTEHNIILCDEITSSLDAKRGKDTIDALLLQAKQNNSMIIFIDHSLYVSTKVNKVIFLDISASDYATQGTVVYFDTHSNLCQNNDRYRSLFMKENI